MKNPKRFVVALLHALTLLACSLGVGARDATASVSELLQQAPAKSCLVVASHQLRATCDAFSATDLGGKLGGAEFAPLVKELQRLERGSPLHLRPWIGLDWSQLAKVNSSSVMAIVPLEDGSAGIVWLFDAATEKQALAKSVADYYASQRWTVKQKSVGNSSATTFSPPVGSKQAPRIWFENAKCYGMASSSAALNAVLATKPEQSFASREVAKSFATTADAPPANVAYYLEPLVLGKALSAPPVGKKLPLRDPVLVAERLGLGGVQQATGELKFSTSGGWQVAAHAVIPQPYPKALKMLEMLPGERLDLPNWIGKDVAHVSHWRWDFVQGMQAFGHVFDEASDPGPDGEGLFEQVLDGLRDDPEGPRVDLRTELFPKLGPDVTTISQQGHAVTVVDIAPQHNAAVDDFMHRFYRNDAAVELQKVGDFRVWSGKGNLPIFAEAGEPNESSIRAMALGKNRLWIATNTPWLKEVIAQVAEDKAENPLAKARAWEAYRATREQLSSDATAYESFSQPALGWRASYDAATKPLAAKQTDSPMTRAWLFLLFGSSRRDAAMPYAAAPAFASWGKDLPATGLFLSRDKSGWDIDLVPLPVAR